MIQFGKEITDPLERFLDSVAGVYPAALKRTTKVFSYVENAVGLSNRQKKERAVSVRGVLFIARDYVPEGEFWLVDEEGNVLQKVKKLGASQ